jgi:hypothetical protein
MTKFKKPDPVDFASARTLLRESALTRGYFSEKRLSILIKESFSRGSIFENDGVHVICGREEYRLIMSYIGR